MKKFVLKCLLLATVVWGTVVCVNYMIDPARLVHNGIIDKMVNALSSGNIIEDPGDLNEGIFQREMIRALCKVPETLVLGSSHIMYIDWGDYDDVYVAGLSGAYFDDELSLLGIMEENGKIPERVIFDIEPWFFKQGTEARHSSISSYGMKEKEKILGNGKKLKSKGEFAIQDTAARIKEMLSFSYFQSSMKFFRSYGLEGCFEREKDVVTICSDAEVGTVEKILPNGRRTVSLKSLETTVEQNEADVREMIMRNSIYQLENSFDSLSEQKCMEFIAMVEYLQEKNVEIVFYLPAWFPSLYDYFSSEGAYIGVLEAEQFVREVGKKYGITVHGSYNPYNRLTAGDFANWGHLKPEKALEDFRFVL